jgi:mRNA-degrading endonuclease HigB of HigAB toxin-antitoxin module
LSYDSWNIEVVQAFIEKHRDVSSSFVFVNELENATWNSPYEMKQSFPTAINQGGCTVLI